MTDVIWGHECMVEGTHRKCKCGVCGEEFCPNDRFTCKGAKAVEPVEGATGAREFWNTLPHCAGYGGNCDGDLVGIEHEKSCPLFGKKELNYFEFADAYALSQAADHVAEVDRLTKERDEAIALTEEARKTLSEDTSYGAIIETLFRAPLVETESKLRAAEQRISELTTANEEKAKKIVGLFVAFAPDTEPYQGKMKQIAAILNGGQQ